MLSARDSPGAAAAGSSNSEDDSQSRSPTPGSSRRTAHTGKQGGLTALGYGLAVACKHLRPFIPFFLISSLVVALVYLLQTIVYGGPFTDPLFFVKFNERWPRPGPHHQVSPSPPKLFSPVPSAVQDLLDLHTDNGTV